MENHEKVAQASSSTDEGAAYRAFRTKCLKAARRRPTNWLDRLFQRFAIALQEERDLRDHMDESLRAADQRHAKPNWFLRRVN